jgi:hypothetical protein
MEATVDGIIRCHVIIAGALHLIAHSAEQRLCSVPSVRFPDRPFHSAALAGAVIGTHDGQAMTGTSSMIDIRPQARRMAEEE